MNTTTLRRTLSAAALCLALGVSGCVFQPLYGSNNTYAPGTDAYALSAVWIPEVDTRVGQQVRNHLIFLLEGGRGSVQPQYEARIRVRDTNKEFAPTRTVRDNTAGSVTVTVSYDLIEKASNSLIGGGTRIATAAYDRTSQSFANSRAVRDAENRAAKEAAELVRLAIAADLGR